MNDNDRLEGNGGNDSLDGGAGFDTAEFNGPRAAYTVSPITSGVRVVGPDGTDTVTFIQALAFDNGTFDPVIAILGDVLWRNDDGKDDHLARQPAERRSLVRSGWLSSTSSTSQGQILRVIEARVKADRMIPAYPST